MNPQPITITITAETAQAAQDLQKFVLESNQKIHLMATGNKEVSETFHQVREVVHKGEYVFSAPAVARIGVPALDAMHRDVAGSAAGSPAGGSASMRDSLKQNFIFVSNPGDVQRQIEQSDAHEHYIMNVVGRNIHKIKV